MNYTFHQAKDNNNKTKMPEILKNRKTGLVASKNFKEGETNYTEVGFVVNDTYLDQKRFYC